MAVQFGPLSCPPPRVVQREVKEDPPRVRERIVHRVDPRPSPGDLQEALLHEVLGEAEIPGHEVRSSEEPVRRGGDERVEVLSGIGAIRAPGHGDIAGRTAHRWLQPPEGVERLPLVRRILPR